MRNPLQSKPVDRHTFAGAIALTLTQSDCCGPGKCCAGACIPFVKKCAGICVPNIGQC
jgi:hypothetical protein